MWRRNRGHYVSVEILDRERQMQQSSGIHSSRREYIPAMKSLPVTAQVQMPYMYVNETRPKVIEEIE